MLNYAPREQPSRANRPRLSFRKQPAFPGIHDCMGCFRDGMPHAFEFVTKPYRVSDQLDGSITQARVYRNRIRMMSFIGSELLEVLGMVAGSCRPCPLLSNRPARSSDCLILLRRYISTATTQRAMPGGIFCHNSLKQTCMCSLPFYSVADSASARQTSTKSAG